MRQQLLQVDTTDADITSQKAYEEKQAVAVEAAGLQSPAERRAAVCRDAALLLAALEASEGGSYHTK